MIANAGIADFVPFLEGTDESWDQQIGIDLKGTWLALQEAARQMVKEGHGGAMVVVSSTNAYQPEQEGVFYNTSKSGQVAVMHTAAMELGKHGIRVNGIAPGIINTRLSWFVIKDPVQSKVFLDRTPMGRFAESDRDGQADPVHVLGRRVVHVRRADGRRRCLLRRPARAGRARRAARPRRRPLGGAQ